ncbi:MAG: response regulator [Myxococcales bacterium FL481]|nr:MAG: response regulator [Myxococcales bacterium FL481]
MLRLMLRRLGCVIEDAMDGATAIEKVTERRFDLVFMDCEMPMMDGFEATRRIRRLAPPHNEVLVVATTAYVTHDDERRCYAAGMTGFLPKPLDRKALGEWMRARVPGFVERSQQFPCM